MIRGARAALAAGLAACLVLGSAGIGSARPSTSRGAGSAATPELLWERNISPNTLTKAFPYDYNFDPIVATHPTNPDRMAVSYNALRNNSGIACTRLVNGLRITVDGGRTWREAGAMPWQGTGRAPGWHGMVAWGPGPSPDGPARLYWTNTTTAGCDYTRHRLSIAWSDDLGDHWSDMFTYRTTPETDGGYPDITVDRNPSSPNYGVVYAAINWIPNSSSEPGLRLIASSDYGNTWKGVEIKPAAAPQGYPFAYRISYRLRTGPDGSLFVGFNQADMRSAGGGFGRLGFGIARVYYDREARTFRVHKPHIVRTVSLNAWAIGSAAAPGSTDPRRLPPRWAYGIDVDPVTGHVYLAIPNYISGAGTGDPRGRVHVGRSADRGRHWSWKELPRLPTIGGRAQSEHKPTLAVRDGKVFVGIHGLVDVPFGTSPNAGRATVGNYYTVSYDGAVTFKRPKALSDTRWDLEALSVPGNRTDVTRNRAGLRDRAEFTADGDVVYVYGDGRLARPEPDDRAGRGQIYAALISLNGGS